MSDYPAIPFPDELVHLEPVSYTHLDEDRAMIQDIRPLEILILNLMPLKEETETQLMRALSNTPALSRILVIASAVQLKSSWHAPPIKAKAQIAVRMNPSISIAPKSVSYLNLLIIIGANTNSIGHNP